MGKIAIGGEKRKESQSKAFKIILLKKWWGQ